MNKIWILILVILLTSCSSNKKFKIWAHVAYKGYGGLKYKFKDSGARNLTVIFYNDSIIVRNFTSLSIAYYGSLSFKCNYSYKKLGQYGSVIIKKLLSCDKNLSKENYTRPYDFRKKYMGNNPVEQIFPNLEGDTLYFSDDFKKLQVKEFCFDRAKK